MNDSGFSSCALFSLLGLCVIVLFPSLSTPVCAEDSYLALKNVRMKWLKYRGVERWLYKEYTRQAVDRLSERKKNIQRIQGLEEWKKRQEDVRKTLREVVGTFSDPPSFNAVVSPEIEREHVTVRNVLIEPTSGYFISGSLFIPRPRSGPHPGILYCSGHNMTKAYRNDTYQTVILNLVRKGFVVFAFDPVDQGERRNVVKSHSHAGVRSFMIGETLAGHMIRDAKRSLDFLMQRPEVDPERIGVTGRSGGGTQSAYLNAFDDRIDAVAIENYLTRFSRLFQSIGPQDGEQHFYHGIHHGIDHPDLVEVAAPRPTLMIGTTRDYFNVQGFLDTYREAKDIYRAYEKPEHLQYVLDEAEHTSTRENREALNRFLMKHLGIEGDPSEEDVTPFPVQKLHISASRKLPDDRLKTTTFDLDRKRYRELSDKRSSYNSKRKLKSAVRSLAGVEKPDAHRAVLTGVYDRDGYKLKTYFLERPSYPIPFLLLRPDDPNGRHLVYLDPKSKNHALHNHTLEPLARRGYTVVLPDLAGAGELSPWPVSRKKFWFLATQIHRSFVGTRLTGLLELVRFFREKRDVNTENLFYAGRGNMGPVVLHGALLSDHLQHVAVENSLLRYGGLFEIEDYADEIVPGLVPGALTAYDLPDLVKAHAPSDLVILNPRRVNRAPVKKDAQVLGRIRNFYDKENAGRKLQIRTELEEDTVRDVLGEWVRNDE